MDRSSHHSSGTRTPRNDHPIRRDHNSENRSAPYETGKRTIHQNNAGGNSIQFNGTANVRTLNMTGPEPASLPPANRVVDLPEHVARPPSSGTRHSSAQISNDDGGGVTGERISPRAGNNPQQRDAGLNGELTLAAGPNIAPAPAPAPAQPLGFDNVSLTQADRRGSSEAGYHQQPQGGYTVEQTHAPVPNIGSAPFFQAGGYPDLDVLTQASDFGIDHFHPYGGFASSAQMYAVPGSSTAGQMQFQGHPQLQTNAVPGSSTPRPDGVQTNAVPGSSTAGHLQPTTTAPSSTVSQQHSPQFWNNILSQASEKRS